MSRLVRRSALSALLFCGLLASSHCGLAQDAEDWLERASAAQSAGNFADAAKDYAQATILSPDVPELWSNRGVMEYMAGQLDASVASLKKALQLKPGLYAPMVFLGKAYVRLGKPALAIPWLNQAHAIQPRDTEVLIALARANADLGNRRVAIGLYSDTTRIDARNSVAWFGLGVSSLDVITADGRKLATTQPDSLWARALHADELLVQGRPVEATDRYRTAWSLASPSQRATLMQALNWMESNPDLYPLPQNSQDALRKLIADFSAAPANPASPSCEAIEPSSDTGSEVSSGKLMHQAECAYWSGDYPGSSNLAGKLLRRDPTNAEALYWSIKANERIAVAALSRFEEINPQSSKDYVMVGDLYRLQKQMDNALKEYNKALAIDPHDLSALMGSADAYFENGNLDQAAALDQSALADRPQDVQLNLLMADILAARNQFDLAKPYLDKCLDAPPELQSRVHALLGRAAAEEGKTKEAIHQFELALPGDKDGSVHYQLSRLYQKVGELAKMRQAQAEAKSLMHKRDANAAIAIREATAPEP